MFDNSMNDSSRIDSYRAAAEDRWQDSQAEDDIICPGCGAEGYATDDHDDGYCVDCAPEDDAPALHECTTPGCHVKIFGTHTTCKYCADDITDAELAQDERGALITSVYSRHDRTASTNCVECGNHIGIPHFADGLCDDCHARYIAAEIAADNAQARTTEDEAPPVSLYATVKAVLEQNRNRCLDSTHERNAVARALVAALTPEEDPRASWTGDEVYACWSSSEKKACAGCPNVPFCSGDVSTFEELREDAAPEFCGYCPDCGATLNAKSPFPVCQKCFDKGDAPATIKMVPDDEPYDTILSVLQDMDSYCLDSTHERSDVARALVAALTPEIETGYCCVALGCNKPAEQNFQLCSDCEVDAEIAADNVPQPQRLTDEEAQDELWRESRDDQRAQSDLHSQIL